MRDPHVEIECDGIDCENTLILNLTHIDDIWDCRNIQPQIENAGWITKDNKHFCEGCQEDETTISIKDDALLLACRYRGLIND